MKKYQPRHRRLIPRYIQRSVPLPTSDSDILKLIDDEEFENAAEHDFMKSQAHMLGRLGNAAAEEF
jgi:hypothetical protein